MSGRLIQVSTEKVLGVPASDFQNNLKCQKKYQVNRDGVSTYIEPDFWTYAEDKSGGSS